MARSKASSQRLASWIFGGISFCFLIGVFIFGPDELPAEKQRILGLICSVFAGLFGYFFTGSIKLMAEGQLSKWSKITIQAGGGAAFFVLVLLWWGSDFAPVTRMEEKLDNVTKDVVDIKKNVTDIKKDVRQVVSIVGMLREELSLKSEQLVCLQGYIASLEKVVPSERARQLADQIPDDASAYALALKAIAQQRFDDARRLLSVPVRYVNYPDLWHRTQQDVFAANLLQPPFDGSS